MLGLQMGSAPSRLPWSRVEFHSCGRKSLSLTLPGRTLWLLLAMALPGGGLCILGARKLAPRRRRERKIVPPRDRPLSYDPFEKGSATEKRSMPRRSGNPPEIFSPRPDNKDNPIRAW